MKLEKVQICDKTVSPITINSGIITTEASCLENIANEVHEVGILTTKSISLKPKTGYREPIIAQYPYMPYSFINAVGLANPGAEEFANRLGKIKFPQEKFLLISIYGADVNEFREVARILEKYADAIEANLGCPNVSEGGMLFGQNPNKTQEVIKAIREVTKKPIFAKLTPNTNRIGVIAKAAIDAGAYGITAINTFPWIPTFEENYVLTNKIGGLSGKIIRDIGIRCVKEITDTIGNVPVIACGGIRTAEDIIRYASAKASAFGIGSALAGMTLAELKVYFPTLIADIENGTNNAEGLLKPVDMQYKRFKVAEKVSFAKDFHVLQMESPLEALAGQYVFASIPEKGEKPFSVMDTEPLTICFLERGCFTKELAKLNKGDTIYFRGPYGKTIDIPADAKVDLVGGGSGIAGIYLFAKQHKSKISQIFIGAKDKQHLLLWGELRKHMKSYGITEDCSLGPKGFVTDLLNKHLKDDNFFINCGPRAMIDAVVEMERRFTTPDRIYSSIEYMTSCGVGICGKCANEKGLRTCVEGPFMQST